MESSSDDAPCYRDFCFCFLKTIIRVSRHQPTVGVSSFIPALLQVSSFKSQDSANTLQELYPDIPAT